MPNEKWTKGPWSFDGNHVVDAAGKVLVVSGIAFPCGYTPREDDSYGNARLIAAAPELYEACKMALKYIEWGQEWEEIAKAVSKAEGRNA